MRDWNDGIPDTAPPEIPAELRGPVLLGLPSGHCEGLTYEQASDLHRELGQNLARAGCGSVEARHRRIQTSAERPWR